MIPQTPYGDVVEQSFRQAVTAAGAAVSDVERFNPSAGAVMEPAAAIAKSGCDAVFIAQGGAEVLITSPEALEKEPYATVGTRIVAG